MLDGTARNVAPQCIHTSKNTTKYVNAPTADSQSSEENTNHPTPLKHILQTLKNANHDNPRVKQQNMILLVGTQVLHNQT